MLHQNQVVRRDNLNVHKAERVRDFVGANECTLLFLPPFSPNFASIEQAWSKLKVLLRGIGVHTKGVLNSAVHGALELATTRDAIGWLAHGSYASS